MEHYPSWGVEQVWGSDRFYSEGDVAKDMIAFVMDTGVAPLDDLNVNTEWSKSFIEGEDPLTDLRGHGTAVASVIGAKANGEGLTGVAPGAEIVAIQVLDKRGRGRGVIDDGLSYVREVINANNLHDKAVVNMSLGLLSANQFEQVLEMADEGIKFAIAAGNHAVDIDRVSPACYGEHENVWTITANDRDGVAAWFTNYDDADEDGDGTDFSAPGAVVPTYNTDGTISNKNGTSFAAPHVAGLLLMSGNIKSGDTIDLLPAQIEKGMVADRLAMFDPDSYLHGDDPFIPTPTPPVEPEPPVEPPAPTPPPLDKRVNWVGTNEDDTITGMNNRDKLRGKKGNDYIRGFEGNDVLRGGKGDDILDGGTGADIIITGFGADRVSDQRDGDSDLILIRHGQGVKTLQGLDATDTVLIQNVRDDDISVAVVAKAFGIYADKDLVAVYTPNDLGFNEFQDMVVGMN